jgi:hypothetical protein
MSGSFAGNDAVNSEIAGSNCAYCAVGGLIGASANKIMKDVFLKNGGRPDDGSMGFVYYYEKVSGRKLNPGFRGGNQQEFQVEGIVHYLETYGCTIRRIGDTSPLGLLSPRQLLREANRLSEGTVFLVFTGEAYGVAGICTAGHWTLGQKQNGKAMFFDHQLMIVRGSVRSFVARRTGNDLNDGFGLETGRTDYPVVAWGERLDEEDGKGMLLVVSKARRRLT